MPITLITSGCKAISFMMNSKQLSEGPMGEIQPVSFQVKWIKPATNYVKLITDGAYDASTGNGEIGFLLRNINGQCTVEGWKTTMEMEAEYNEALAIKNGLQMALQERNTYLAVESDNLRLIKILKKEATTPWPIRNCINNILPLLSKFQLIVLSHTPRDGNKVAHSLAMHAKLMRENRVWKSQWPPFLSCILSSDELVDNVTFFNS